MYVYIFTHTRREQSARYRNNDGDDGNVRGGGYFVYASTFRPAGAFAFLAFFSLSFTLFLFLYTMYIRGINTHKQTNMLASMPAKQDSLATKEHYSEKKTLFIPNEPKRRNVMNGSCYARQHKQMADIFSQYNEEMTCVCRCACVCMCTHCLLVVVALTPP